MVKNDIYPAVCPWDIYIGPWTSASVSVQLNRINDRAYDKNSVTNIKECLLNDDYIVATVLMISIRFTVTW